MQGKYKVITLCGSSRFENEFMRMQKQLSLAGNIVLLPLFFSKSGGEDILEILIKRQCLKLKKCLGICIKEK